ncbi:hypothetical protein [Deinococcus misasensis]|uniref:hypothetical protein n=1 Tax=Deinococcus misasensis TaxID=392413 RepID=UPI00054F1A30|nr:hypothetical protein [Deinococcus misasensis]
MTSSTRAGYIPRNETLSYFRWAEGNPILFLLRFILFGEGDIAPVTHEILRKAEPELQYRPYVHVGG